MQGSGMLVFLWEAGRSWILGRSVRLYFIVGFNINIIGMDDAFRGTILLISCWATVREGIIQVKVQVNTSPFAPSWMD